MKKTNIAFYIIFSILFLVACSTEKNGFINRNYHAVTTEYNILYNGQLAFDKGNNEAIATYQDNFWKLLPIERLANTTEKASITQTKNTSYDKAEEKAIKAIQKHSMNIEGEEHNPQMDEAHLMLGKSRYLTGRFLPALEAFNYILYKDANSNKAAEAKIWREKTNVRLQNEETAISNLKRFLKFNKPTDVIIAEAEATLSQAYYNSNKPDTALYHLKKANVYAQNNEQKARYQYIIGQYYQMLQHKDSAVVAFQSVIDRKRKSPRVYIINAHAQIANLTENKDSLAFAEKFSKLIEDIENKSFLDILHQQMGHFYAEKKHHKAALYHYNQSLLHRTPDDKRIAVNYLKMAEIHFKDRLFLKAKQYYDSTLSFVPKSDKEYRLLQQKHNYLDAVVQHETVVSNNDSIKRILAMTEVEKIRFFEKQIALQLLKDKKAVASNLNNSSRNSPTIAGTTPANNMLLPVAMPTVPGAVAFYFYNPTLVAMGKEAFSRKWGNRALKDNWRWENQADITNKTTVVDSTQQKGVTTNTKDVSFYIKQLPSQPDALQKLNTDVHESLYQLGLLYKENLKEDALAIERFTRLLQEKPNETLYQAGSYYLYQLLEKTDKTKANEIKNRLIENYPNSSYAKVLQNETTSNDREAIYQPIYNLYAKGQLRAANEVLIKEIVLTKDIDFRAQLEMLQANVDARLLGLQAYKKELQKIAATYIKTPISEQAAQILEKTVPLLEEKKWQKDAPSWKIIFIVPFPHQAVAKQLEKQLQKYVKDRDAYFIKTSTDVYTNTQDCMVLHGYDSEEAAASTLLFLQKDKRYQVKAKGIVVNTHNYELIQQNKSLEIYQQLNK